MEGGHGFPNSKLLLLQRGVYMKWDCVSKQDDTS